MAPFWFLLPAVTRDGEPLREPRIPVCLDLPKAEDFFRVSLLSGP
jgi:hypothetical protein